MGRSPPLPHHPQRHRQRGPAGAQYAGLSGLINIKRDDALLHYLTGHYPSLSPDGSPVRRAASLCICQSAGPGKPSSVVPWPDCGPCHSQPDCAPLPLNHQPTQRPRKLATAQSASVPCCVLYRHPVPRRDCRPPSTPQVATAGRSRPTALLGCKPDNRARSPPASLFRCRITPFGGFGLIKRAKSLLSTTAHTTSYRYWPLRAATHLAQGLPRQASNLPDSTSIVPSAILGGFSGSAQASSSWL